MKTEIACIILVVVLFIGAVGLGINAMKSYNCAARWSESSYPHTKYGFVAGCRVSKDGKIYLPSTSVREF